MFIEAPSDDFRRGAAIGKLPSLTNRDEVTASIVGKISLVNMSGFEASPEQDPREVVRSDCQLDSGGVSRTTNELDKAALEVKVILNTRGL